MNWPCNQEDDHFLNHIRVKENTKSSNIQRFCNNQNFEHD
jgi:hypothetical protein